MSDSDQAVIRQWGLFNEDDPQGRAIPYPASYVIDLEAQITWVHIGMSTRDRPEPGEILNQVVAAAR